MRDSTNMNKFWKLRVHAWVCQIKTNPELDKEFFFFSKRLLQCEEHYDLKSL